MRELIESLVLTWMQLYRLHFNRIPSYADLTILAEFNLKGERDKLTDEEFDELCQAYRKAVSRI